MKNTLIKWILPAALILLAMIWISCSKEQNPVKYETHPDGWADVNSAQFHGNYDPNCAECHAAKIPYVETEEKECYKCHDHNMTPMYVCDACHALPPTSNAGLPSNMAAGAFGAHAAHGNYACTECHTNSLSDYSHAQAPLPARVAFSRADLATRYPFSNAAYTHVRAANSGNGTCSNVYCHSNGFGGAPVRTASWVGGSISCGDCHSIPPSEPRHPRNNVCSECHFTVDPASDFSDVVNHPERIHFLPQYADKHINGLIEE